ncbi:MAG: hypothetical protein FWG67_09695 [Defluviitaleaceae bacterium]|nr:hypothetical protein [Defluviitaleaceae bacterium]
MKKEAFEQQIQTYEALLKQQKHRFKLIGFVKLAHICFVGFLIYVIFAGDARTMTLMISGVIAAVLVVFWLYHEKLKARIKYGEGIVAINRCHLERISGQWSGFADVGSEFVNQEHPYGSDLDIVGKKSLFQLLNTTHTWHGRQRFAADLLNPDYTADELMMRQAAIKELSEDLVFSNDIQYQFSQIGVHTAAKFIPTWLADQTVLMKRKSLILLVLYGPLILLLLAAFTFLTRLSVLYLAVAFLFACQLLVWGISSFKTGQYLAQVSRLSDNLEAYTPVIHALQHRSFTSDKLVMIQASLSESQHGAAVGIKELAQLAKRINLRRNGMAFVILNSLLLFDWVTAIRFEAWKNKYASHAASWFSNLGEFESLLSFSHLPNVMTSACLPTVVEEKMMVAKQLGHPLITNEKRVSNDMTCQNQIFIISGSNMSGKTTFMRSVGVNLILARAGSFVCAKEMSFFPLHVMTSMRIADDLNAGISTFYGELKRIKGIIDLAKKQPNLLFLIDEIFRGTNSVDRLIGAKTILEKLNALGVMGMITTHDLELCDLAATHMRIQNYSFSETYTEQGIHFDYQLKSGKSLTTNATYLMKMMDMI